MHTGIRIRSWVQGAIVGTGLVIAGCSRDELAEPSAPPSNPLPPGDSIALTSTNRLVSLDRATRSIRSGVALTGLQSGETVLGIDFRPGGAPAGQLYLLSSNARLYTVDVATGVATFRFALSADPTDTTAPFAGLSGAQFGVDFNPVVDRMRVVSNTGQNLRINVDTGATITDGDLNVGGVTRTGITSVAYTSNFAAACRTTLYYLDSSADRLFTTTDPNNGALTDVGALGADAGSVNSFDIVSNPDNSSSAFALVASPAGQNLQAISLATGAVVDLGAVTGLNSGESLAMLAVPPVTTVPTQLPGELVATTASNQLLSFTAAAPQKTCTSAAIIGLQTNENILGMDLRPADGLLYALGSTGRLYTLAPATGAATMVSQLAADPADATAPFTALSGTEFGVDFNPAADRLRVVSDTGQSLRINVTNGLTTTDTNLNPAGSSVTAAAYTNSFAGTGTTALYVIDTMNDRLMLQGQPSGNPNNGDLQAVGTLGIAGDVQAMSAFDIDGRVNTAYAALNVGTATTSDLYTVNLATGAATRVNTIGGGEKIRGLTLGARAQATVFGVTATNRLIGFNVTAPGTLTTDLAITGLQGGENIVGADFRPANGALYALTDAGRIVSISTTTAAVSAPISLAADATDTTNPFATLSGTAFGVDFNPVPDRLRVASDSNVNLRINVATGATITDSTLNPIGSAITSAAYTNSFPSPASTTLYVIDALAPRLMIQGQPSGSPNNGDLLAVGNLGVTVNAGGITGFDIVGGDNGLVLAALQPMGATQSSLYRINLSTGTATLIGAIGPVGTPLVRGIAVRLQ